MDTEEHETWENTSKGRVALRKIDVRGLEKTELVAGGRKFQITSRERRMNQDLVAAKEMDPFMNGVLRPVRLLEGTEDEQTLTNNPNHLSDADMIAILGLHYKKFDERLDEITNIGTLEHLLELAQGDSVNATVRAVRKIDRRLRQLNPVHVGEAQMVESDVTSGAMSSGVRPVTTR